MRCKEVVLIVAMMFFQCQSAYAAKDSKAPEGYRWEACEIITCSFLVPDGWKFERIKNKESVQFVMTKQRHTQPLAPRLLINVLQKAKLRTDMPAERHIDLFMKDLQRSARILDNWERTSGVFKSVAATATHYGYADTLIKKFHLLIANTSTDTLYVMSFEAVSTEWGQDWRMIERVFEQLRLDESI